MRRNRGDQSSEGDYPADFGSYIVNKRRKLTDQYAQHATSAISTDDSSTNLDTLFKGVTAFVSNSIFCTIQREGKEQSVDHREISRLVQLHGGVLLHKHDKTMTHFVCSAVPVWLKREQEKNIAKYKFVSPMWVIDSVLAGVRLDPTEYFPNPQAPQGVSRPPSNGAATVALPHIMQVKSIAPTSSNSKVSIDSFSSGLKKIGDMMPEPVNTLTAPKPALNRQQSVNFSAITVDDSTDISADAPALRLRQAPVNEKLARPMPSWYNSVATSYDRANAADQSKPVFRSTNSRGEGEMDDGPGRMLTSKENPNFVSDYFASSRLHHLSRWRIDFQQQLTSYLLNLGSDEDDGNGKVPAPTNGPDRIIAHIDMDAFFVSVSSRNRPDLVGKPVVISHGGARGTCASVNYVARKMGVHNGWRLAEAERLCGSSLVVLPYDFEAYEQVSKAMYEVFLKYTKQIQVLSCDEALLDLTEAADRNYDSALAIATRIRDEVKIKTQCDCSAGLGNSRTLASLALRQAKPNGCVAAPRLLDPASADFQMMKKMVSVGLQANPLVSDLERALGGLNPDIVSKSKLLSWISTFKVEHMKGIGPAIEDKLEEMGVKEIGKLQLCSLSTLQQTFGEKQGIKLFLAARGMDDRPLKYLQERKSVSVELSFGVRFDTLEQVYRFIDDISQELQRRAKAAGLKGKTIVLNVMQRHPDAKPTTFLGHGWCITHSKGQTIPEYTDSTEVFRSIGVKLFRLINVPPGEVRGVGLHLSHLANSKSAQGLTSLDTVINKMKRPAPAPMIQPAKVAAASKDIREEHAPQAPSRRPIMRHRDADEFGDDDEDNTDDDDLMALDVDIYEQAPAVPVQTAHDVENDPSQEVVALEDVAPMIVSPQADDKIRHTIQEVLSHAADFGAPSKTIMELFAQYATSLVYSRNLEMVTWLLQKLRFTISKNRDWAVGMNLVIDHTQRLVKAKYGAFIVLES